MRKGSREFSVSGAYCIRAHRLNEWKPDGKQQPDAPISKPWRGVKEDE